MKREVIWNAHFIVDFFEKIKERKEEKRFP
jgi:hypothetical protein